jgi:thiosulfate/3-mercaptopyruvate sulfurtransferase
MQPNLSRALGRLVLPCLLGAAFQLQAADLPGPLVDTQWLADNLDSVVVLDIRRDPQSFIRKAGGGGKVAGIQACGAKGGPVGVSGHIPGAALVEWKEIAVKEKTGSVELHDSLPTKAAFESLMRERGVNRDSAVVIANPGDGVAAVADGRSLPRCSARGWSPSWRENPVVG